MSGDIVPSNMRRYNRVVLETAAVLHIQEIYVLSCSMCTLITKNKGKFVDDLRLYVCMSVDIRLYVM